LEKPTHAIIVLSQLDTRYFKEIAGISSWTLEFALVKRGETDPLSEATPTLLYSRSVNLEIDLDVGEYVVYVSPRSYHLRVRVLRLLSSPGSFRSHDLQGTGKIVPSHSIFRYRYLYRHYRITSRRESIAAGTTANCPGY
jgi:hypothetical protein